MLYIFSWAYNFSPFHILTILAPARPVWKTTSSPGTPHVSLLIFGVVFKSISIHLVPHSCAEASSIYKAVKRIRSHVQVPWQRAGFAWDEDEDADENERMMLMMLLVMMMMMMLVMMMMMVVIMAVVLLLMMVMMMMIMAMMMMMMVMMMVMMIMMMMVMVIMS